VLPKAREKNLGFDQGDKFAFFPPKHDNMFRDTFRKWPLVEAYDRLGNKLFV
jgi:hypothetical protein